MEPVESGMPASDLPPGIGRPAWRALTGAGYWRLEQLTAVRAEDLLKLHGVGPKALSVIRAALAAQDLTLAGEA